MHGIFTCIIYIYIHNIINSWPTIVKIGLYQKTAIDSLRILNSYIQNTPCMKELPVAYIMYIYIYYIFFIHPRDSRPTNGLMDLYQITLVLLMTLLCIYIYIFQTLHVMEYGSIALSIAYTCMRDSWPTLVWMGLSQTAIVYTYFYI